MKKNLLLLAFVTIFFSHFAIAETADVNQTVVPYTLADRDRGIRMEAKMEQMDKRFDQMLTFMGWMVMAFVAMTGGVFAFAWWDRRSMIRPFEEKTKLMDIAIEALNNDKADIRVIKVLKDLSKTDAKLAELLKLHNIL